VAHAAKSGVVTRRLHLVLLFSFGVQPHKSNTTSCGANHSYKPLCSIASHCCGQKTPSNNQRNRLVVTGQHNLAEEYSRKMKST
jgi:hypothetical protein